MSDPICEFKDDTEAQACAEWWQERLFLHDWVIKVSHANRHEIEGLAGRNEMQIDLMTAKISLCTPDDYLRGLYLKQCSELTLVHELLHCKYNWLKCDGSYEGRYVDTMDHQLLEQMARSLIMARYDLAPGWFSNI